MRRLLQALAVAVLFGCGGGAEGNRDRGMGEACDDPSQCVHALCVAGVAGSEPACTRSCSDTSDCPTGWSCSGVTSANILVCQQGAGNPFGVGARE